MKIIHEDLFKYQGPEHAIFVCTCQTINKNGKLVMGVGQARQAAVRFPWLPEQAVRNYDICSLVGHDNHTNTRLGIFPIKEHWGDEADLELVHYSSFRLKQYAIKHPSTTFHCEFPVIHGNGLKYSEVTKLLEDLNIPDNVWFHIK